MLKNILRLSMMCGALVLFLGCSHGRHHHGHHKGQSCEGRSCALKKKKCAGHSCALKKKKCDGRSCKMKKAGTPSVWFISPQDGAKVGRKFKVQFGVKWMGIHPAGTLVEGTGHHHLVINGGAIEKGQVVPSDKNNLHFGKGQVETFVELPKGQHRLTLQFADGAHLSYGASMSATITVHVE